MTDFQTIDSDKLETTCGGVTVPMPSPVPQVPQVVRDVASRVGQWVGDKVRQFTQPRYK